MAQPPPEPKSVRASLEGREDGYRLRIWTERGALAIFLEASSRRAKTNPWDAAPAAQGEIDPTGCDNAEGLIGEIAAWLGVDGTDAGAPSEGGVGCGHDGFDAAFDVAGTSWTAIHLVFGAQEPYAGLHLQFVPKTGEGLLLESHVGTPELLVRYLRSALTAS